MQERHLRRIIIGCIVGAVHAAALFLIVFGTESGGTTPEPNAAVFKLSDIDEAPPPPPPEEEPVQENTQDPVADNLVETESVENTLIASVTNNASNAQQEDYLPQNKISILPRFNEKEILSALVSPPIAQRSGIEGVVVLELFINKSGFVTRIRVLKESPEGHDFGAAAVKAFTGARCTPAQANGEDVAVRYRYPVRFQLRN